MAAGGQELLMLTSDKGVSCLHLEASEGQLELVQRLVEAEQPGKQGVLMASELDHGCLENAETSSKRHLEVVKALVAARGQELPMLKTNDGFTGLHAASWAGQ